MKLCPECRSPVYSLMFIDKKLEPEFHCERCCRAVETIDSPAPVKPEPVLA